MTMPKLGNLTLYDEGSINVFGPDGEGSVITTPSDLSEAYPLEGDNVQRSSSEKPIVRSLEERVRAVVEVYKDANISQNNPWRDDTIQTNDPRIETGNTVQFQPRNHGNTIQFQPRNYGNTIQFDPRNSNHGNTNQFDPRNSYQGNTNQIISQKQQDSSHRGAILNSAKKIHVRPKRAAVDHQANHVKDVESIQSHLEQVVLADGGDTLNQNRGSSVQDLQRELAKQTARRANQVIHKINQQSVNQDSQQVRQDSQQANEDSQSVNQNSQQVKQDSQQFKQDSQQVSQNSQQVKQDTLQVKQDLQQVKQDSQQLKQDSQQVKQDSQQVKQDSEQDNQDQKPVKQDSYLKDPNKHATLRKLMFVSVNPPQQQSQPQGSRTGQTTVYFQPGTSQQNASNLSQDAILTRMYSAREYIRRMQKIVQIYKYDITSKQLSDQILRRFGVRMQAPQLRYYADYDPWIYNQNITKCGTDGNILLNEKVAKSVVLRYMKSIDRVIPHQYVLDRIINVQENHDIINGDRYHMELDLYDYTKNKKVRVSQYIYQQIGYTEFCTPQNFKISHHATVHVIIPVKNQGRWVQYFIDNMSELYVRTGDPHLNVIIVDFSSDDIDVKEALKRSPLVRYRVITLTGPFQRAFGIQAGAAIITDPNDVIFMCDLHLEIPNNMIDVIRKHTIQGRMAFAPIVLRLHCGFTPTIPYGFWELQGYGLFAIYKSDFNRVGGMNYREFGTRWGGEDWELLDRVLLHKMEVERLRVPNFYHFYHSKKGMWGSPTIDIVHSDIGGQYYLNKNQIIPLYRPRARAVTINSYKRSKLQNTNIVNNKQRNLRGKRLPSRVIRPASRVRRGYRPKQIPRAVDQNGGKIYY